MAKALRAELIPVTNIPMRLLDTSSRIGGYGNNEYIRTANDGFDVEAMVIMNNLRAEYEQLLGDKILVRFLAGVVNMKEKGSDYPVLELIGLLNAELYNPLNKRVENSLHFIESSHYDDEISFVDKNHADRVAKVLNDLSVGKRRY